MDDPDEQRSSHNNLDEIQHELSESDSASCNSISNPYYDGPIGDETEGSSEGTQPLERRGSSRSVHLKQPIKNNEVVIVALDLGYFKTCIGFLRLTQLVNPFPLQTPFLPLPQRHHFILLYVVIIDSM